MVHARSPLALASPSQELVVTPVIVPSSQADPVPFLLTKRVHEPMYSTQDTSWSIKRSSSTVKTTRNRHGVRCRFLATRRSHGVSALQWKTVDSLPHFFRGYVGISAFFRVTWEVALILFDTHMKHGSLTRDGTLVDFGSPIVYDTREQYSFEYSWRDSNPRAPPITARSPTTELQK
jgi:hypothetical protein